MSLRQDGRPTLREQLRAEMPVTKNYAYFDHAAVAPLPLSTSHAICEYAIQSQNAGDVPWLEWAAKLNGLRSLLAELLNASPDEIALVSNTTQGINFVAEGFPWRRGDNLVLPDNEFPSNMLPWQNLERLGVEIRFVPVEADGRVQPEMFLPLIDAKTRLVTFSWVGFASGFRADVPKIVELAHRQNALVMLDAIQGLGAFPMDVKHLDIDFVAADGHKWMLGPEGAGMLYVKREHLSLLQPRGLGWNSLVGGGFEPGATEIKRTAARYEGGTYNMPGMHGLYASLQLLKDVGLNAHRVADQILENVGLLEQRLTSEGFQVAIPSQPGNRSGIVGVCWSSAKQSPQLLSEARKFLIREHVVTSVRGNRLRVSTHAYNDASDIDRLVRGLVAFRNQESHS